ncbi:hypothetical protein DFP73DRAFT_369460 [Morchella snyderi]|nr:hypothetical protein DFP73DRAFT_369460 [Morchella snyderi]
MYTLVLLGFIFLMVGWECISAWSVVTITYFSSFFFNLFLSSFSFLLFIFGYSLRNQKNGIGIFGFGIFTGGKMRVVEICVTFFFTLWMEHGTFFVQICILVS